ncbi:GspE/PulE family protein [Vibrio breoganii]
MSIFDAFNKFLNFELKLGKNQEPKLALKTEDKADAKKPAPSVKVIRVIENVPKFSQIISLTKSHKIDESKKERILVVDDEIIENYIILDISTSTEQKAILLASTEMMKSGTIDKTFLVLKKRVRDKGFKVGKKEFAAKEIIKLLYEKHTEKSASGVSNEDEAAMITDFDTMLSEALADKTSDIHIEVTGETAKVRYRINGVLNDINSWSRDYAEKMAKVIYTVVAEEKDVTFDPSIPQPAIINRSVVVPGEGKATLRVRLNTMPAYPNGFNVIMRLIRTGQSQSNLTLPMLGYSDLMVESIKESIGKPVGCTIIAGTTGSGKSTSLSVMLSGTVSANSDENGSCKIKIITVEDPPEYEVNNVTQSPVVRSKSSGDENPFAAAIKAAMRSDPDILMVGEVRDDHSAELLVDAVQSGHQAFTTIHAPSAIGIIARLRSLGVSNDVLGNGEFVAGLIYQALLPLLCDNCKIPLHKHTEMVGSGDIFLEDVSSYQQMIDRVKTICSEDELEGIYMKSASGCEDCKGTGIAGRSVIAEVILPDKYMVKCFGESREEDALAHYIENGGLLAIDHGVLKMKTGIADPRSVEDKVGWVNTTNLPRPQSESDEDINTDKGEDILEVEGQDSSDTKTIETNGTEGQAFKSDLLSSDIDPPNPNILKLNISSKSDS